MKFQHLYLSVLDFLMTELDVILNYIKMAQKLKDKTTLRFWIYLELRKYTTEIVIHALEFVLQKYLINGFLNWKSALNKKRPRK